MVLKTLKIVDGRYAPLIYTLRWLMIVSFRRFAPPVDGKTRTTRSNKLTQYEWSPPHLKHVVLG